MNKRTLIASPRQGVAGEIEAKIAGRKRLFKRPIADQSQQLALKVTGVPSGNRAQMLANVRSGLGYKVISYLEDAFRVPQKEIAGVLSIPASTLTRRKKEGRLHADESDRVVRLAALKDAALALMQGNDDAAVAWLQTPLGILGGESPLQHASTEIGARDVEDLIGRIRHGVFS